MAPTEPAISRSPVNELRTATFLRVLEQASGELESRLFQLGDLARIGKLFESTSRLDDVASRGLEIFLEASNAENGSIMLLSPEGDELFLLAAGSSHGSISFFGAKGHPRRMFGPGEGLAGACLIEQKPLLSNDVSQDTRYRPGVEQVPMGSLASIPMMVDGQPFGVVNVSHPEPSRLDPAGAPMWSLLAGYLGIALSNALHVLKLKQANEALKIQVSHRTQSLEEANRRLRAAQEKIARNNEELKIRVEERTRELEGALATLRERSESLEQANRIKGEFLNNINHELKTPLNAIIGYAGLLLQEAGDRLAPEQRSDLELVEANGKHLQMIVDNILALKHIEGGSLAPETAPTDLVDLLLMAVSSVGPRARAKGLALRFEPGDRQLPLLLLDSTFIRRVIFNLLDNAIKFSPSGCITVRVLTPEPAQGQQPMVRVEVEDEGLGVRPEDSERIFEKFQQAEPAMRKHEGGSGVGLTIARTLVELHGGRLTFEDAPVKGSLFAFTLPMHTA